MIARIWCGAVAKADGDANADYIDETVSHYEVDRYVSP
jgi:hypothetical protein